MSLLGMWCAEVSKPFLSFEGSLAQELTDTPDNVFSYAKLQRSLRQYRNMKEARLVEQKHSKGPHAVYGSRKKFPWDLHKMNVVTIA